jgi:hypothetical protein
MARQIGIHGVMFLAAILSAPTIRAQQPDGAKNDPPEQRVAPDPPVLFSGSNNGSGQDLRPATKVGVHAAAGEPSPSGVQELTLDRKAGVHSFLMPSVSGVSQLATNSSASGYSRPTASTYLLGTLDLNRESGRSDLLLHYTGGGMFSSYMNSAIQDVNFSYRFKWQRWSLLLGDQFSYLSESSFGFGGVGGLAFLSGGSQTGLFLNGSLTPNQTIPTGFVPRLSNALISQMEYELSPRSSWTASGSFGMLNFLGAGYINSTDGEFQTGYHYLINPQSSITLNYRFDDFRFAPFSQVTEDHVVQLGYARNVTGRLSLKFAAGPSEEIFRGVVTGNSNRLSWALDSSLDYQLDRTTLLIGFNRLVTGGSGVLVGAQTTQLEATVVRKLASRGQTSASMGYATNRSLVQNTASFGSGSLNAWYAAVRLDRQLRPGSAIFLSYGARLQAGISAACAPPNCGTRSISHEISAGFNFGLRPILLR